MGRRRRALAGASMPSSYPSLPEPMLTRPILSLHTKPELVPLTKPHSLRSLSYLLRFRTHRISSDSAHTASPQIPHTPHLIRFRTHRISSDSAHTAAPCYQAQVDASEDF